MPKDTVSQTLSFVELLQPFFPLKKLPKFKNDAIQGSFYIKASHDS